MMTPMPGPYPWQGGEPLSEGELDMLCREWMETLGIGHWRFTLRVLRQFDIGERRIGFVSTEHRSAFFRMELLHPMDYDPWVTDPEMDLELAMVHELCHVRYALIDDHVDQKNEAEMTHYEQAIHATAVALVRMRRKLRALEPSARSLQRVTV